VRGRLEGTLFQTEFPVMRQFVDKTDTLGAS